MEITLSEVWEHRVNTMSEARGQSAEEVVEEALGTLYFMTVAGGFPTGEPDPRRDGEGMSEG